MRKKRIPIQWMAAGLGALLSSACVFAPEIDLDLDAQVVAKAKKRNASRLPAAHGSLDGDQASQRLTSIERRMTRNEAKLSATQSELRNLRLRGPQPASHAPRRLRGSAVFEDGRQIGLRISGLDPDDYLRVMGLRNGDVVLAANGRELSSDREALMAWRDAARTGGWALIIEREGRRQVFNARFPT